MSVQLSWNRASDYESEGREFESLNGRQRHIQQILLITRLVQLVERKHAKFEVTGSSPVFCTKSNCVLNMGLLVQWQHESLWHSKPEFNSLISPQQSYRGIWLKRNEIDRCSLRDSQYGCVDATAGRVFPESLGVMNPVPATKDKNHNLILLKNYDIIYM